MDKRIEALNRIVYDNLSRILKSLHKRIHIKLYAMIYDQDDNVAETIRIKKTVVAPYIVQDKLQTAASVFAEMKVDPAQAGDTYEAIAAYIDQTWDKQNVQTETASTDNAPVRQSHDNRILYINRIPFLGESDSHVAYIVEMRNVEQETRKLFYAKPEISFLRMLLDFYFEDFYAGAGHAVTVDSDGAIARKYNEDSKQFNRRMTRLFFGKMQAYIQDGTSYDSFGSVWANKPMNEYYVNSLLEKIDDISNLTYENASPFGSILIMNKHTIADQGIIHFTVTFTENDRIRLEDAKRIRKLLELTNVDNDLYLIADEKEIYGLGEVNWNMVKGSLALRIDFNGLSKYSMILVRPEAEPDSRGKLFVEDDQKLYRSNLRLNEMKLAAVSFKNPRLGEEGYSSDKFTSLLRNEFWEDEQDSGQIGARLERLDRIVRHAREQKHGTMVVITEPETAIEELKHLSKQSTLIEPDIIDPAYIKFLTAIDGAIYFDTEGRCHAIGVILDGIAKDDIGDASRGARFNSAHRYLHKLKDNQEQPRKCAIVIISEDGMVDLIPESEHEDMLIAMAEEVIDMLNEENPDRAKILEKEQTLLQSKIVDSEWLFKIAEVYEDNDQYDRAIDFFEYGIERAERSYIPSGYYNLLGNCYHYKQKYEEAIRMYDIALADRNNDDEENQIYLGNSGNSSLQLALQTKETQKFSLAIERITQAIKFEKSQSIALSAHNFTNRGRSYLELSDLESKREKKLQSLRQSVEDYTQGILLEPDVDTWYWNRFCAYDRLELVKESIDDLIRAECLKHEDKYIDNLARLFKKKPNYVFESLELFKELIGDSEGPEQLRTLLDKQLAIAEISKQAEAAAGRTPDAEVSEQAENQ